MSEHWASSQSGLVIMESRLKWRKLRKKKKSGWLDTHIIQMYRIFPHKATISFSIKCWISSKLVFLSFWIDENTVKMAFYINIRRGVISSFLFYICVYPTLLVFNVYISMKKIQCIFCVLGYIPIEKKFSSFFFYRSMMKI